MCSRGQPLTNKEDDINQLCHDVASLNCVQLLDSLAEKQEVDVDALRTVFVSYLDAFQNAFRSEITKRLENQDKVCIEQEPWFTDYVTLKPLVHDQDCKPGSSLVARAQKITKKAACVLLSNNHSDTHDENGSLAG